MNSTIKAIQALSPELHFRMEDNDLSTLESLNGEDLPTIKQIEDKAKVIEAEEATAQAEKAQAKEALLAQLGITEEQLKLLFS